jgi:HAD superfamily hydrolase (TIGR01549 family)
MEKKKLAIFDVDGTLVNSHSGVAKALLETFEKVFGVEKKFEDIQPYAALPFAHIIQVVFPSFTEQQFADANKLYKEIYFNKFVRDVDLFPDVEKVLKNLSKKYYLSTATNMSTTGARRLLDKLHIADIFDHIAGTEDFSQAKPDPYVLLEAMDMFGVDAKNTVMIGDSPRDIQAGKNANTQTIAVVFGHHVSSVITVQNPSFIAKSFLEIEKYLVNPEK